MIFKGRKVKEMEGLSKDEQKIARLRKQIDERDARIDEQARLLKNANAKLRRRDARITELEAEIANYRQGIIEHIERPLGVPEVITGIAAEFVRLSR